MTIPRNSRPKILFLFSDTGGGHRSAAEAIIEALEIEYGDRFDAEMVDFFRQYTPLPLNRAPQLYPHMVRIPRAWELSYRLSNGARRARFVHASLSPYLGRSLRSLIDQHPSDLIVSVHPLINGPLLNASGPKRPPYIIVVTDLVSTHVTWYDRRANLCIVPTEPARERALRYGIKPERVFVVGLPVAQRFCQTAEDHFAARTRLGWSDGLPVILLVGGSEGMGPLERTAMAIAQARLRARLVVVSGRNQALRRRLQSKHWPIPAEIHGYVRDMPDFMRAADILVTKAGPGTICEAFNAGLPMILYSRLPGQEEGNVSYVVSNGAGIWAPEPAGVVSAVARWLDSPTDREASARASAQLARPDASRVTARLIADHLQ